MGGSCNKPRPGHFKRYIHGGGSPVIPRNTTENRKILTPCKAIKAPARGFYYVLIHLLNDHIKAP